MKKYMLAAIAAPAILLMASCSTDSGESTAKFSVPAYNLITYPQTGAAPVVEAGIYAYSMDLNNATTVITAELTNGDSSNRNITLSGNPMSYKAYYYNAGGNTHEILYMEKMDAGTATGGELWRDFKGELTTLAFVPPTIPGIPAVTYPMLSALRYSVISYYIGADKYVRTFWNDITFNGKTQTEYTGRDGQVKNFTTDKIKYRVRMDLDKKTAMVVFYDAKFTDVEQEPTKTNIVLENLPVTFDNNGYTIAGTDIVPKCFENGTGVPNENYKFNSFTLTCGGDLTQAACSYEVAGIYKGSFTGSYLTRLKDLQQSDK